MDELDSATGRSVCKHSEQITMLMSLALDGMLDRDGHYRMEQHLTTCPACQAEWAAMQKVATLLEAEPMIGPPLGFAIRVERRLEEKSRQQRRAFGGVAVVASWLSLAGLTVAAVVLLLGGIATWQWLGSQPGLQQGILAAIQLASGMGLIGKGASLFLGDLLQRYGPPLVVSLAIGLTVLAGTWTWLVVKRPGRSHRNGYV
jgi:predicted anti-sigma-YlaC factor YlaD